jgi:hypothetical protein
MSNAPSMMLREFIKTFKGSLDPRLWIKLIKEETAEYDEAVVNNDRVEMLKEACDIMYVLTGFMVVTNGGADPDIMQKDEIEEWQTTAETAEERFLAATNIFGEETLVKAFQRIHLSNMSKLGLCGKPLFREDGKVLKGPNYKKPYLTDLVVEIA